MMNITTKIPTRVSMLDYPSVTIPMATRCECCESLMPAGFAAAQVDGLLACTATCCASLDEGRLNAALGRCDIQWFHAQPDIQRLSEKIYQLERSGVSKELETQIIDLETNRYARRLAWETVHESDKRDMQAQLRLVSQARSRALIRRPLSLAV